MYDNLFVRIQEFTILIENNLKLTLLIDQCSRDESWEQIESFASNRERSLGVIEKTQIDIENCINYLSPDKLDNEIINIIKAWAQETQSWISRTQMLDNNILLNLEKQKDQTTQEIAQIFKSKQAFKGYDLRDVSK